MSATLGNLKSSQKFGVVFPVETLADLPSEDIAESTLVWVIEGRSLWVFRGNGWECVGKLLPSQEKIKI